MENGEHKNNGEGTTCMMCSFHKAMHGKSLCGACGGANHFSLLRLILALAIVGFVFYAGMEFGEMKGGQYGSYGKHSRMMKAGSYCSPQMMQADYGMDGSDGTYGGEQYLR